MSAALRLAVRLYLSRWPRLLFLSSCVAAGVCFLVGVGSVRSAVDAAVAAKARELMAADVELASQRPLPPRALAALERLRAEGHRAAETVSFSSMLSFPGGDPFLSSVKAPAPGYPFYGALETSPPGLFPSGLDALLDEAAAKERGLAPGARLKLGGVELRLAGLILKEPDRGVSGFNLAPRLMISPEAADKSGLLRFGARVRRAALVALPAGAEEPARARALKERLERELDDPYVSIAAYTDAEPAVRETLERVGTFFVFLSLVALVLGGAGMAAGFALFLDEQLETAALLRCLGASARELAVCYGAQAVAVGLQGGALGAAAGWALGAAFVEPAAARLGLPLAASPRWDWALAAEGLGLALALAAALNSAAVAALARVSPAETLRESSARLRVSLRARAALIVLGSAALFLYAFAKSNSWQSARAFAGALGGSALAALLLILGAVALLGRVPLARLGFGVRHGVLALTRRRGRAVVLLFTLAMGLTLLGALGIVHRSLRSEILLGRSALAPDLFLVDIQKSQLAGVSGVLARHSSVIARPAPLVRARLTHVNGAPVARRDLSGLTVEERARQRFLTREYNLTYKDELQDSERVIQGRFWAPGESGPQISLERSFARRVGVTLGDRLSFDVQGRPVEGVVSSLREVEWVSMRPNFFVVFPVRALEGAPQTFVTSVRAGDPARSSALRRELAGPYPNVSVIDLSKALDNVQSVLGALIGALELLAWFCLAVGLLVLAGTLGLERRERVRQAALYRALGASSRELLLMDLGEFLALGAAAVAIAGAVSHGLAWAVARQMNLGASFDPRSLALIAAAGLLLPLSAGLLIHAPVRRAQPLSLLRDEG